MESMGRTLVFKFLWEMGTSLNNGIWCQTLISALSIMYNVSQRQNRCLNIQTPPIDQLTKSLETTSIGFTLPFIPAAPLGGIFASLRPHLRDFRFTPTIGRVFRRRRINAGWQPIVICKSFHRKHRQLS